MLPPLKTPSVAQIQQLRHHVGMTQKEFGEWLHAKTRTVQDWEMGRTPLHLGLWELALIKAERIKPLPTVWAKD
jgi:DNA-binding transcriptional regulator YiaG